MDSESFYILTHTQSLYRSIVYILYRVVQVGIKMCDILSSPDGINWKHVVSIKDFDIAYEFTVGLSLDNIGRYYRIVDTTFNILQKLGIIRN